MPLPLVLDFSAVEFTDEQFVQFCSDNHGLRIELSAERELIVMPPANPNTGSKNHYISGELYIWSKQDGTGLGFDSSSGFTLPNAPCVRPMHLGCHVRNGMLFHKRTGTGFRTSCQTL